MSKPSSYQNRFESSLRFVKQQVADIEYFACYFSAFLKRTSARVDFVVYQDGTCIRHNGEFERLPGDHSRLEVPRWCESLQKILKLGRL